MNDIYLLPLSGVVEVLGTVVVVDVLLLRDDVVVVVEVLDIVAVVLGVDLLVLRDDVVLVVVVLMDDDGVLGVVRPVCDVDERPASVVVVVDDEAPLPQRMATSSRCEQLCTPQPLCLQSPSSASTPWHCTLSSQIVPLPTPKRFPTLPP